MEKELVKALEKYRGQRIHEYRYNNIDYVTLLIRVFSNNDFPDFITPEDLIEVMQTELKEMN